MPRHYILEVKVREHNLFHERVQEHFIYEVSVYKLIIILNWRTLKYYLKSEGTLTLILINEGA